MEIYSASQYGVCFVLIIHIHDAKLQFEPGSTTNLEKKRWLSVSVLIICAFYVSRCHVHHWLARKLLSTEPKVPGLRVWIQSTA